jgi:hypothetical protein
VPWVSPVLLIHALPALARFDLTIFAPCGVK